MVKLKGWQIMLIMQLVVPVLERLQKMVAAKAVEDAEENWLDVVAEAFKSVIDILKSGEVFVKG
ncbi:MAG: hypothetical protein SVO01_00465 [Thermotogota bacterium]|nr:hypothetical protein [Thermotogota bacterium]